MIERRNGWMLIAALGCVALTAAVLGTGLLWPDWEGARAEAGVPLREVMAVYGSWLVGLAAVPAALLAAGVRLFAVQRAHRAIPLLAVLALTFGSLVLIASSGGRIELHGSLYIVMAVVSFYERPSLLWLMTGLFALQLGLGSALWPELVYGEAQYPLIMVIVQTMLLVLTASAISWLLATNRRHRQEEADEQARLREDNARDVRFKLSSALYELLAASESLLQASSMTIGTNRDLAVRLGSVVDDSASHVEKTQAVKSHLEQVSADITRLADACITVLEGTIAATRNADAGKVAIAQLSRQLEALAEAMQRSESVTGELIRSSAETAALVKLTRDLADQAHLLALNASIEAARAGEQGRGSGAVAVEMHRLAKKSANFAEQIARRVASMGREAQQASSAVGAAREELERGMQLVLATGRTFQAILDSTKSIAAQIEDISASAERVTAGSQQSAAAAQEIAVTARRFSAWCRQADSAIAEQSAALTQIADISADLHRLSDRLRDIIKQLEA
ncbi:methyl-accepting chemotaxis protein [Paenibacillus sp. HJGM_3]|uniref:methyl-accepting chemotaxis protein n=1 Tax=Paenibacillus sp. HJGM_3 TaxID=3379816 RepID=UPI00385A4C51